MQFISFSVIYMYLEVKFVSMATIVKFYLPSVGSNFEWGSLKPCDNFLVIPIYTILSEKGIFQCVQLNV